MTVLLLIMFNGFLFSISPSSVHNNKSTNQSPVIEQTCPEEKSGPVKELLLDNSDEAGVNPLLKKEAPKDKPTGCPVSMNS